jgi:sugar lactone lactonase YvrE
VTAEPRAVWEVGALLGEGPMWLPAEQALWFVDIKGGRLHRFDPASGSGESFATGGMPSFVVPTLDGGLLVGSGNALHRFEDGRLGPAIATVDEPAHNRSNDATVDRDGRLWFGTMDDDEQVPTGRLYCYDRGSVRATGWQAVVTNGPAISGDGRWLYHVDSGARTIGKVAVDGADLADEGEVFVRLNQDEGFTDGVVVDAQDCLWVALWDGWAVRRYSPAGELLLHVPFPCPRVTKVAFGGPDLTTVYATTARTGLDAAALAASPLAGSLFAFTAPAPGRVLPAVRLA